MEKLISASTGTVSGRTHNKSMDTGQNKPLAEFQRAWGNILLSLRSHSNQALNAGFGLLIVLTAVCYLPARDTMNAFAPYWYILVSNVTLNFVIFLGIWGYFTEWYAKKKQWGKRKSMLFWLITTLMLFVLLRLGGMETIFG